MTVPNCLLVILAAAVTAAAPDPGTVHTFEVPQTNQPYKYETKWFEQRVDHFNFAGNDTTFKQKYLINKDNWENQADPSGPIFFYTGNEGEIEAFAQNTGLMWEMSVRLKAMVVFAEHRYYGKSIPFGPEALKPNPELNAYLTSEQALADYAELVTYLKKTEAGAAHSPVIAFGGSYGGMLAAWFRMKYPHICDGAIAASAPVAQFEPNPCDAFNRMVTSDYTSAIADFPACSDNIRRSWKALDNLGAKAEGLKWVSDTFKLCKPFTKNEQIQQLKDFLADVWTNMAMMNYPYPTSFLKPLPGYPVTAACEKMANALKSPEVKVPAIKGPSGNSTSTPAPAATNATDTAANVTTTTTPAPTTTTKSTTTPKPATTPKPDPFKADKDLLTLIEAAASIYWNYTKTTKCLDISDADDIGADMWEYQACTEMVFPMCSDNVNDMFEKKLWNLTEYKENCKKTWKVTPREDMASLMYGRKRLEAASNIVFSNGLLDPWMSGGIISNVTESVVSIIMLMGAHHLDLRATDPIHDPEEVTLARKKEEQNIRKWIKEANDRAAKAKQRNLPDLRDLALMFEDL